MKKYFTIVIRADDESAARQLVPGEKIGPNEITACSLGDVLTLQDKLAELIPDDRQDEADALHCANLAAFTASRKTRPLTDLPPTV